MREPGFYFVKIGHAGPWEIAQFIGGCGWIMLGVGAETELFDDYFAMIGDRILPPA